MLYGMPRLACARVAGGGVGVLCGPTPGSPRARMLPFKWLVGDQYPSFLLSII